MDGDDADAGGCLGMTDVEIALPPMHVRFLEMQQFIDPHPGVNEDEHRVHAGGIGVLPQPVNFLPAEWMMWSHRFVFPNLDEPVKRSVRILHPQCILESQGQQRANLFAGTV